MEYITTKKGKITGHFCGEKIPKGAVQVSDWWGNVGDPVNYYDKNWKRKDDLTLYKAGLKELPKGYRLNDAETAVVEMSEVEKIQAGVKEIPSGMKIENDKLVQMSSKELFDSGLITEEQYTETVKSQVDSEINNRLSAINTTENQAKAFIDDDFKEKMKTALKKVLSVKEQKGYPLVVSWTDIPESL